MANIAISELNTEATTLASDDLFLISKKDGSSFTSAKIKASNANGLANVRFVDGGAQVYISPSGSDDNIELQWKYYGTEQQKNYPLYTLNKACDFLGRFRCISRNNNTAYSICCADGVYSYNTEQDIFHPECSTTGSYVNITPTTPVNNTNVQFNFTQPKNTVDGNIGIRHYSNCMMRCCHVSSTNKLTVGIYVPDSVRSTIYGVKVTNFDSGISCDNMNWCSISSYYPDNGQTLSTHVPTEISSVNIGISSNGRVSVYGYIRINSTNSCIVCNGRRISLSYWTPLKFDLKTSSSYIFDSWNHNSSMYMGNIISTRTVEINTFSSSKTYASNDEVFNIPANSTIYNPLGFIGVHNDILAAITTGLNQNKF